jgi:prepilin-type N-terminal cleavage/methylation domain-containing protein
MLRNKKGFTLIEMLVVIAVIAVLVSIIIPTVTAATTKAQAATDAANLRSVMGQLNGILANSNKMSANQAQGLQTADSKMYPGAKMLIVYQNPGFIDAYYMIDGKYYGMNYFSAVALYGLDGAEGISTAKPTGTGYEWYEAGVGAFSG